MAGYFIANFTIHDGEKWKQYLEVTPGIEAFGGRSVVREQNPTVLKGEPHQVIVVIEFESVETTKRWYGSPEYQAAVGLFLDSVEGWVIIAGEITDPHDLNPV